MLDRQLQARLLGQLAESYPHTVHSGVFLGWLPDLAPILANFAYLQEHGLVETETDTLMSGELVFDEAKITAKGLDFLADDGGMTAILGVVTVKLHDDTIRAILLERIEAAPGDPSLKKGLAAKVLEEATLYALRAGLAEASNPLSLIARALSGAP